MIQLVGSVMFKGPTHWKSAINIVPEGSDLSPVQVQNSVNNRSEGIYGILITWRVEVMLGRRAILLDDIIRARHDMHQIPDETESEECDACVQVTINTHKSVTVETHLSSQRCEEGVLVDYICGRSQHGTVVARKLMWSHAALLEREHLDCGLCLARCMLREADPTKSSMLNS